MIRFSTNLFSKRAQNKNKKELSNLVNPFRRDKFMVRMKEKLCLCSQHLKQKRAGSTTCRAQSTWTTRALSYIQHAGCKVWVYFVFSQGHAAVKGKEQKAWKIQEVKGPVSMFLKFRFNRR